MSVLFLGSDVSSSACEPPPGGPLPESKNLDGRPVWEPPAFCYDHLIGEEYEKKRESLMKYTNNDAVHTTKIMDTKTEADILSMYSGWLMSNIVEGQDGDDFEVLHRTGFYLGLAKEVFRDFVDVDGEFKKLGVAMWRSYDGTYSTVGIEWEASSERFKGGEKDGTRSNEEDYNAMHDARFVSFPVGGRKASLLKLDMGVYSLVPVWRAVSAGVTQQTPLALRLVFESTRNRADGHNDENAGLENEGVE